MRHRHQAAPWVLGISLLVSLASSNVQASNSTTTAFKAYERGLTLFAQRDYVGAQHAFEEAYRAVPNPIVLLGIAEAQQRRGLWQNAATSLERYLSQRPRAPDRAKVERSIVRVKALLATRIARTKLIPVTIVHEDKMSSAYRLVKAVYSINGVPVLTRVDDRGQLDAHQQFNLHRAKMPPGPHTLSVHLVYRGSKFGVFSYLDEYRYHVHSSHSFNADLGKGLRLKVISYDCGDPTASRAERPAVRYEVSELGRNAELNSAAPPRL